MRYIITALLSFGLAVLIYAEDLKDIKFYNLEKEYAETITAIYQVNNAQALELKQIVSGMLSIYGSLYVNEKTNQLYITDVQKKIADIKSLLPGLDVKDIKAGNNLVSKLVYMKHENVSEIIGLIKHKLSPDGSVLEAPNLNALVITDVSSKIDELVELLNIVDVPGAHIAVEISIIDFNNEYFSKKGVNIFNWLQGLTVGANVNFGGPGKFNASAALGGGSPPPGRNWDENTVTNTTAGNETKSFGKQFYLSSTLSVSDLVNFISENADGAVLASSRIVTRSNKPASINSYERIPIRAHPADMTVKAYPQNVVVTGLSVRVVPTLHQDSLINLNIVPSIADLTGWTPAGLPIVFERSLNTEVKVRNNTIFALGGLKRKETVDIRRGIPFLKDIPVLRYLFSVRQKVQLEREVLIFIKPSVDVNTEIKAESFQQLKKKFEAEPK
jgi:type IV pilus assembly protein PilQ